MAILPDNTWAVPMGVGAITGRSAKNWTNLASVGGGGCIIIGARCQQSLNMLIVHLQVMNPNPEQVWEMVDSIRTNGEKVDLFFASATIVDNVDAMAPWTKGVIAGGTEKDWSGNVLVRKGTRLAIERDSGTCLTDFQPTDVHIDSEAGVKNVAINAPIDWKDLRGVSAALAKVRPRIGSA